MGVHIKRKSTPKDGSTWTWAMGATLASISLFLSLGSYNPKDPSLNTFSGTWGEPTNILGFFGSWTSDLLLQAFGWSAWVIPGLMLVAVLRWLQNEKRSQTHAINRRFWGALLVAQCSTSILVAIFVSKKVSESLGYMPQGLLGSGLYSLSKSFLGATGSFLLSVTLFWAFCMLWWTSLPLYFAELCMWALDRSPSPSQMAKFFWGGLNKAFRFIAGNLKMPTRLGKGPEASSDDELHNQTKIGVGELKVFDEDGESDSKKADEILAIQVRPPLVKTISPESATAETPSKVKEPRAKSAHPKKWELPPLSLLEFSKKKIKGPTKDQLIETAKKISRALKSFEIEGDVVEISPGPIITMYEFQPGSGVRVQKILSVHTDLAMALGVPSVRIVAPIPGKSVAGIEVPNQDKQEIVLRDVFENTYEKSKTLKLPLVLGKDGEGNPILEDLSRMPHLLIGGATNQGKSVLMNSILTGLLCRFTPNEMKLIIVDPKLVEFKAFEDIPHLLLPIVNDPNDASQALKWAVAETKRRYLMMQKYSAKNLESYNLKIADKSNWIEGEEAPESFSFIVIIIDELAELMMTAKKDVEQSIVRLTQLARAAGIHLIMATQRPSADIVTSLIKSNCPSRASMKVASATDSRIILDCGGAEQLLGRGDMFFTNTGPMGLRRLQGAYVSDAEVEKIGDFWRSQGEPVFKDEILAPEPEEVSGDGSTESRDVLYADVLSFARDKGKISTSLIQRKFQVGYTRAARIMEQLEAAGIVGEVSTPGQPRDVII